MKTRILNIWYVNEGGETIIKLRLKPERGRNYVLDVYGTESWFFIPKGEHIPDDSRIVSIEDGPLSLFREPTVKITTKYPNDVRDLKQSYTCTNVHPENPWSKTFQADIRRALKTMIDESWYDGLEVPTGLTSCHVSDIKPLPIEEVEHIEIHRGRFDIETWHKPGRFPDPKRKTNVVISISIKYKEEHHVWFQRKGEEDEKDPEPVENYKVHVFDTEAQVLTAFFEWVKTEEPDLLSCWHKRFDCRYLNTRVILKKSEKSLYKYRQRSNRTIDTQILDVQVIDIYEGYSRVGDAGNNKLKTVVKYEELVEEVVSAEYEVKWWGTDNTKLCYYNWMDSVYVELIDEKKGIFDFFWGLRRVAGLPYIEDVFYNSRIIDALLMRMLKHKYVLPTKKEEEKKEKFAGAVVYEPVPGFYTEGIGIMDFSRAYPTFMIKHNLSPEVFQLGLKEEGCLPALCRVLLEERERHEEVMDKIFQCDGPECDEYKTAKLKRDQVKFLLNAVYGVVGSPYFRIYMKEVSATVTRIGREALGTIREKAQEMNIEVIYGDTDSVFLEVDSPEEGERVAEVLEKHVNDWFDGLVVDEQYIQEAATA